MNLLERRMIFTNNICKLVTFITNQCIGVTIGECYRTQEQAEIYAKQGVGIKDSQHCKGLAVDINLFCNGEYLKDVKDYKIAGQYWEYLHNNNRWGGNWDRDDTPFESGEFDAGHFEMIG